MRLPAHLRRSRHHIFYFRIVIPAHLRPLFNGRRELLQSLGTRDPKLAKLWAYSLSAKVSATFEKAKAAMTNGDDPTKNKWDEMKAIAKMEKEKLRELLNSSKIAAEDYCLEIGIPGLFTIKSDPAIPGDDAAAIKAAECLFASPLVREHMEKMSAQAESERALLKQAVAQGMSTATPQTTVNHLTAIPPEWGGYRPTLLSEAIALYRKDHFENLSEATQKAYNRALNWFPEFFQQDPYMHDIDEKVIRGWKKKMVIPHFKNVAADKVAKDIQQGRLVLDPLVGAPTVTHEIRSVDAQITHLNAFFKVMQIEKRYPQHMTLPTKGQTEVTHAARKKLPGWEKFEESELKDIFAPANLLALVKPHEFWMPLLGLFTGGRLNELAQLTQKDIHQEGGIWVLRIRDQDYFQKLKNTASERKIPLHPTLVALGFLDYIKDAREAVPPEAERIFPYLRFDKNNGFGDVPSEGFARYLGKLGIHGRGKVFHSFRKSANDRLKRNHVDEAERCQLVGHVHDTINNTVYGGEPYSMEYLLEHVVPQLKFPEIDFMPLKYEPGRFLEILRTEYDAALRRKRINK